ncbi:MAG: hypothetical protein LBC62_03540 [Treponema sp.]|jgi:hypothetical protein|nr:hypothetical protein [Treponema sp.]
MRFSEIHQEAAPESPNPGEEKPFYAILSVYIPCSVMLASLPLLGRILTVISLSLGGGGLNFPYGVWFLSGLFGGLAASAYSALIKKSQASHAAADIRGGLIILILAYALSSLPGAVRILLWGFFPSLANIPSALTGLVIWFSVLSIKRTFGCRELFELHISLHEGDALKSLMLEDSALMSQADSGIQRLARFYGVWIALTALLALGCSALGVVLPLYFLILLIVLFTAAFCILGFLGMLRREHAFAAEGIALSPADRAFSFPSAALFVITAAGAGLLLSSDSSLLPPGLIAAFFRWLSGLLSARFRPPEAPPPPPQIMDFMPPAPMLPPELMAAAEEQGPWPFWDYLKYGLLALAVFLFLWFMVYPLLNRPRLSLGGISLLEQFRRFLCRWFSALARGIAAFFAALMGGSLRLKNPGLSAAAVHRLAGDILEGYSPAKRREMRRSATLFAKLILWGAETLKVSWKPSYAPGEYCGVLAAATESTAAPATDVPVTASGSGTEGPAKKTGPAVIRCGEIFEKALYAAQPLSREEAREFRELVERIVRV